MTKLDVRVGDGGNKKGLVDIIAAGTKCVWDKKVDDTEIDRFRQIVNEKRGLGLKDYWELHEWSVKNYETFWEEMWHFFGVIHSEPYTQVAKQGRSMLDIEWFCGAKMNFAENLLRFRNDSTAIIYFDTEGNEEKIKYAEMYEEVERYAAAFRKNGLKSGDRVACYMPNRKETVYAFLATTSIGAIWGGPLPYYGDKAASKIIRLLLPKFLITADRFLDSDTEKNLMKNIPTITKDLDSLEKVIICPSKEETLSHDISQLDSRCCFLNEFLESGKEENGSVPLLKFEQLPVNHPICINFTSGTTGIPKGLMHSAGTLLSLLRDLSLHCNLKKGDVILNPYPLGWTLWHIFVPGFALGTTVVLYNTSPFFLTAEFWDVIDRYKVAYTLLATSAVDRMEKKDIVPGPDCQLKHFKKLSVGASPVKLQNFDFLLNRVKKDLFINCSYGSTEAPGTFSGADFNLPVYSAEIQAPSLGVDLQCFDEHGNSVCGQRGEVVICKPYIALPVSLWNDSKGRTLEDLYLSKFPGLWCQNDECWIDPKTKGSVVIGRSDDTLNPNGERFSSADIYYAIHNFEELQDYVCIGQDNDEGDQRLVIFVKLRPGYTFSEKLANRIKEHILNEFTADHVPEIVLEAPDIPYNLNGKKMERLLKTIVATHEIPDTGNIKNPECLEYFRNIPELQGY